MQITAPLARALGGFFSGGGGGVAASGFHRGGTGPGDRSFKRMVDPAAFVGAPRFHAGIGAGEMAAIIRKDESVLTPGQMRQLAPVGRAGGGNVSVTVNNAPAGTQATATTSRDKAGNMRVDVWLQRRVDDTAAALVDTGESAMNKSIERRYGLTPRL